MTRPSLSLRARLLAGLAAVAIVLVGVGVLVTTRTRAGLVGQLDDQLVAASAAERDDYFDRHEHDEHEPPVSPSPSPGPERISLFYEGVLEDDGSVTYTFRPNVGLAPESPPAIDPAAVARALDASGNGVALLVAPAADGHDDYRVLATRRNDTTVIRAISLTDVDDTLHRLIFVELIGFATVLAVLGAVALWVIRLGIRPIREMTLAATEIAAGDLSVRVPQSPWPTTESGQLSSALNAMLATIERSVDEQTKSEARLRQFVADASHELRTPVTTIRGYAELYRHGGLSTDADVADAMRRTEQEAKRMGRLVEDMLMLAKLDEERPSAVDPVDLAALADDAGKDARVTAPDRVITIDTGPALVVRGDEDRLRQVLANVVGNALVHTPEGTPITVRARLDDGAAVVEVADAGPGMAPEVATRITERFYRADPSRSRARGGSGLGMAIVDAVVGSHGGTLTVDSEPGKGTTVRLALPLA